jgi:hypothetical protein
MKQLVIAVLRVLDFLLFPFTLVAAVWMKAIRICGVHRMPVSRKILMSVGVFPVRDHYYEPLINPGRHLTESPRKDRALPGINWNAAGQVDLLAKFNYAAELAQFSLESTGQELAYYYNNHSFGSGDSEFLYSIIRYGKPARIIEIGSGHSTLMAINAIRKNQSENPAYRCEHICIEPYEQPWLEKTGATIIRKKVEDVEPAFFGQLTRNDILFIDSSHIIRPQGDVLFEYLTLLPLVKPGVLVHIHDIFSPKDYLDEWIYGEQKLWNEQYLLEAFLTQNDQFEIIGALNYLAHHHRKLFGEKFPVFGQQAGREPGSFWMVRK